MSPSAPLCSPDKILAPAEPNPRPWLHPRAAYVHIPFCAHHCGYCDFAVAVGQDALIDRYLAALELELATLGEPQPIETLFLGGGTPTHLNARQLERLLSAVLGWLPPAGNHEFSIEANPHMLDAEKIGVLADHQVTRVSLGGQSFQPHLLQVLERDHQPEDVPKAVDIIRRRIAQFSLDLIFGIPGQTLDEWQNDLRQALSLRPDHLSTYGLTFEKGTRLWKQMRQGQFQRLSEENELALYEQGIDTLAAAGFDHYEISNFAKPQCRSRHNQVYWANHAYFGFGMGAARYINGCRETNTRSLATYLQRIERGESAVFQSETLPPEERARETIALNLRRAEGVRRNEFCKQTGFELCLLAGPAIKHLVESGHLEEDAQGIRLTRNGKCVADSVIQTIVRP